MNTQQGFQLAAMQRGIAAVRIARHRGRLVHEQTLWQTGKQNPTAVRAGLGPADLHDIDTCIV